MNDFIPELFFLEVLINKQKPENAYAFSGKFISG